MVVGIWVLDETVDVSLRVPVAVIVVLFPGKLMTVDEADVVDVTLLELVPVVTAVVAVTVAEVEEQLPETHV